MKVDCSCRAQVGGKISRMVSLLAKEDQDVQQPTKGGAKCDIRLDDVLECQARATQSEESVSQSVSQKRRYESRERKAPAS